MRRVSADYRVYINRLELKTSHLDIYPSVKFAIFSDGNILVTKSNETINGEFVYSAVIKTEPACIVFIPRVMRSMVNYHVGDQYDVCCEENEIHLKKYEI